MRADQSLSRIEAIRGGSASTLATNSPAGIINFISNTGEVKGGSVALTSGLNYGEIRTDFSYGMPFGKDMSFHVGGFYRQGEGTRTAGYTANQGGQIKANLTKKFNNGYIRLNYKFLNDRTPAYMPMPLKVSGTNANPVWEGINGYDPYRGTMHSQYFKQNIGTGTDGTTRRVSEVADGMHPVSHAIGGELSFDLGEGFTLENRARFSFNSGRFVTPFPAAVGSVTDILTTIDTSLRNGSLRYANNNTPFTGDVAMIMHMFDTELTNFNNTVNDLKINKSIGDQVYVTAGYFFARQNINMSWLWNSYVSEVKGDGSAQPLDVIRPNGTNISQNGQFAYGVPVWGNCCQVGYNNKYTINAPYVSVLFKATPELNIEGGFRYDLGSVSGNGTSGTVVRKDVNGDGTISPIEEKVAVLNTATPLPVKYKYNYASYSLGANYSFTPQQALFARYSSGGSAKADRAVFPSQAYSEIKNPKDLVDQAEIGYKQRFNSGGLFITAFYSKTTEEGGFEASTQKVIENDYNARGIEIEGSFSFPYFDIRGAATYMNAQIASGINNGNVPRRQPNLMYNLVPTFKWKKHAIGISLIGQTKAFTQDDNKLVMPAYLIVNAFANVHLFKNWTLSFNGNNLANALGITESEEGAITENRNNYIRARPIVGRTISTSLRYNF